MQYCNIHKFWMGIVFFLGMIMRYVACVHVFLVVIARQSESYLWFQPEHSHLHLRAWEKWTWASAREHISTCHVFILSAAPLLSRITLPLSTNPKIIITLKMWSKTTYTIGPKMYIWTTKPNTSNKFASDRYFYILHYIWLK